MVLLYGVRILAVDYFVLSQSTRLTDGQREIDRFRQQDHAYQPSIGGIWGVRYM